MGSSTPKKGMSLGSLVATTYFIVAGGPFGLEDLMASMGYRGAVGAILATALVWSLPTALLVGELASALPHTGGFYAWTRRALGPFWAFQVAWLSFAASVFDMAIYPTLFGLYVARLFPALATPGAQTALGIGLIGTGTLWNLSGAHRVGRGSLWLTGLLLLPFVALCILTWWSPLPPSSPVGPLPSVGPLPTEALPDGHASFATGVLVAMWNLMGWDNAATMASDVDAPSATYPRAIFGALALVVLTYVLPVACMGIAGVPTGGWTTGAWVDAARLFGGLPLALAMAMAGALSAIGMFNALVLSYSRLPEALSADGLLHPALSWRHPATKAPVRAIVLCAVAYTACLTLGFERLVALDVVFYGASLILEFIALIVLRVREPQLRRPFRIPGGVATLVAVALPPSLLLLFAVAAAWKADQDGRGFVLTALVGMAGPLLYGWASRRLPRAIDADETDGSR